MAYDGLVTGAMAIYLNRLLSGGKIEKIYQPDSDELIIHIHTKQGRQRLYISANSSHPRIHLLKEERDQKNPKNPTAFCMLLRKHFQGGRIKEIKQILAERIVELNIRQSDELGFDVDKKITVEIMGKHSNIVAIDISSGKILDSIKRITSDLNRYRQILPGLDYVYPPDHGKISFYEIAAKDLENILNEGDLSLPRTLVKGVQGINPTISEEICRLAIESSKNSSDSLSADDVWEVMNDMKLSIQSATYQTAVYIDKDGLPIDFHIFPLSDMENHLDKITFQNISDGVEYYYTHKLSTNRIKQKSADLTRSLSNMLNKHYLKKQKLSEELYAAENAELYRVYGELLIANIHNIAQGSRKVMVVNYYDGQEVEISLDPRFSASVNAQRYFKKYNKSKIALKEKKVQIQETDSAIGYLESVLVYLENAETIEEIEEIRKELIEGGYLRRKKNTYGITKSSLKPLKFTLEDGSFILVGRNNKENDNLTFKIAHKNDLWFHAKDIPGSHVILISVNGQEPSKEGMLKAASLAAYYSKGRNSINVPIDFTKVKHVKKFHGAKPGMVIYTDYQTIFANPSNS